MTIGRSSHARSTGSLPPSQPGPTQLHQVLCLSKCPHFSSEDSRIRPRFGVSDLAQPGYFRSIASLGAGGMATEAEAVVNGGSVVRVEYGKYLDFAPSLPIQTRFSIFVAFPLHSFPASFPSGTVNSDCRYSYATYSSQYIDVLESSPSPEPRLASAALHSRCALNSRHKNPLGTCFDVKHILCPHHSSVGRA